MLTSSWTAALLASVLPLALASPISGPQQGLFKRSEAGPLIGGVNFPDPSVIQVDGTWYAFGTNDGTVNMQVATSSDFETWELSTNSDGSQYDAFPTLPPWVDASDSRVWAPDVNQLADGSFIVYYTAATASETKQHAVGAAVANSVLGPYTNVGDNWLVYNVTAGGDIDPSGFVDDDGTRYVLWKVDGNSIGAPTPLRIQAVAADGYTLQDSPVTLLQNEGDSDNNIIEAPSLVKVNGTYFLFFSPGLYSTDNYRVAYATAPAVLGPYTRPADPLFATGDDGLTAPGGADVTPDGSRMVFHANSGNGRAMYSAELTFDGLTVSA